MLKKLYIPKGVLAYLSSFFQIKGKKEGKYGFGGGKIISLTGEQYDVDPVLKEPTQDEEFFLSVRFKPLSPIIKEAKIVNDRELKEIRKNSDDLLNIFIPVGRLNNFEEIYDGNYINQNLLLTKKGKERRMAGFYDEGQVYIAGHWMKAPGGELIEVSKTQSFQMGEGDFLFLNFKGSIVYTKEIDKEDFNLDSLGLKKGSQSSAKISTDFFLENDGENGDRETETYDLDFNYPIGQVVNGNFLTFARGNIDLSLSRTELTYFKEINTDIDGCKTAIYETKTTYSILPLFS